MAAPIRAIALFTLVWVPVLAIAGWLATAGYLTSGAAGLASSVWFVVAVGIAATAYRRRALD